MDGNDRELAALKAIASAAATERSPDSDPQETGEWLDSLEAVMEREGPSRAHYLLERLVDQARRNGAYLPYSANTAYLNTIPAGAEERSPGNQQLEARIRSLVRWNAVMQVGKTDENGKPCFL